MEFLVQLLIAAVEMGTPLLLATLGGVISERAGVINLGMEGLMLVGALTAFVVMLHTGSPILAVALAAIAGMAGFSEVSGVHYRLQQNISLGYGYTGIIVAWLARNHPMGILLSSFLMAVIFVSAEILQIEYGLPISVVFLYQGIILFTVLGSEIFVEYRLRLQKIV